MAGTRHTAIRFTCKQNATSRHACFDTPIDMILLPALVTARRELFFFLYPFPRRIFFVICTPNRAELLPCSVRQYDGGGGGGGDGGSRKSQINPLVIPHRSFQPVRISTTRFYATSVLPNPKLSFPFLFPSPVKGETALPCLYLLPLSLCFSASHYPIFAIFSSDIR